MSDQVTPHDRVDPHPILEQYYTDQAERSVFVRRLFDRTARHYDLINRLLSVGTGHWYRQQSLLRAGIRQGMRVLDVATGTGLMARQIAAITGSQDGVYGLDVSVGMLAQARRALNNPLIQGNAENLPIAGESFDCVTMGYALRHVADLNGTFREFHRVLRPQGSLILLEIGRPRTRWREMILRYYLGYLAPVLCHWATGQKEARTLMSYYWDTIAHCVSPATILQSMVNAGFQQVRCEVDFDIFRTYIGRKN